jgi:hypothetical protein
MALRRTPHTAVIYDITDDGVGNVATNPVDATTGYTLRCQITPLPVEVVQTDVGIEYRRPHLVMCNLTAINSGSFTVKVGQKFVYNSVEYRVSKPDESFRGGTRADHMSFEIDRFTS